MGDRYFQRGQGRVFLQEYGPHPKNCYDYQGCARLEGMEESLGDITELQCPDPSVYDEFLVVDEVRGAGGPVTTTMVARFGLVNPILKLQCPFDIAVHYGKCKDPSDFNGGWEKGIVFNRARLASRSLSELTALEEADRSEILVTGAISARKFYEVDPIAFSRKADTYITGEVVAVVVCDTPSCGDCETISDGCQRIYAVCAPSAIVSPGGFPAEVVYTLDGGVTFAEVDITGMDADEAPSDAACVGGNLVVISFDDVTFPLHYAALPDLALWHEVAGGFVGAGSPNAIWSVDARHTWIVGENGYIYFTADPTVGVEIQEAGVAAGNHHLNDVHFIDSLRGIAVGDTQTVVVTENGGITWAGLPVTPGAANLISCWMLTDSIWFVGDDAGHLWFTLDKGDIWIEKAIPITAPTAITEIVFYEGGFGWLAVNDNSEGYILRTRDGGCTWYVLPEDTGTLPTNERINSIAPCDQNTIWAGGLVTGPDGILVLGS